MSNLHIFSRHWIEKKSWKKRKLSTNQIHFEGYQVSDQCMALVRDDCLIPTKDAPELGYVKESSETQYVPDVFYKVSFHDK